MSSAILYLAIIALWAGVLIPRWLKRDTSQASGQPVEPPGSQPAGTDDVAHADEADEDMADSDAGQEARRAEPATSLTDRSGPASRDGARADEPARRREPWDQRRASRKRMLAARQRMLIVVSTLTVAALGIAVIGLAAWWVAVPPTILLAGYLMLLREARRADAEHALLEAAAYRDEQQRRYARTLARSAAQESPGPEPVPAPARESARIIDISERVRDELYDQYADGERRAVGD